MILRPTTVNEKEFESNNESFIDPNLTFDQDFLENKRIRSIKLNNTIQYSLFIIIILIIKL